VTSANNNTPPPWRVGLTGGIASGKTTVAQAFARLGVPVIDTDEIAREVVAPGTAGLEQVVDRFGADVLTADGTLDRPRMRQRVFADSHARRALEGILHPLIWETVEARAAAAASTGSYCLVVVPLLAETGRAAHLDRVLVVDCPPATQIERLMQRDGEDEAGARRILASQASRGQRLAIADDVIDNTGDTAAVTAQVVSLHALYSKLARR
jgi:dephospho-CoA kinase